jgi:hypothetical protein
LEQLRKEKKPDEVVTSSGFFIFRTFIAVHKLAGLCSLYEAVRLKREIYNHAGGIASQSFFIDDLIAKPLSRPSLKQGVVWLAG